MPSTPHGDQEKFAALIGRVFTDKEFAKAVESNPAEALKSAGYTLTPEQVHNMKQPLGSHVDAFPWTKPVVSILTKGTQPVVQVAVNTILTVATPVKAEKETEPPRS